jgi:hypothetical protein
MDYQSRASRRISQPSIRWSCLILIPVIVLGAVGSLSAKPPAKDKNQDQNKDSKKEFPSFELVTSTVKERLAANRGYRPGDLITASSAQAVFGDLAKINWKVSDRRDIARLLLPDGDWLARQLNAPDARSFMRHVAEFPGGFDCVDRYRRMPYGQQNIVDMIHNPGGYTMFEYMTTTANGKNMSRMLTHDVNGANFGKTTGRIYTEKQLLKRLKKSYDQAAIKRLRIEPADDSTPTEKSSTDMPRTRKKSTDDDSGDLFEKPRN